MRMRIFRHFLALLLVPPLLCGCGGRRVALYCPAGDGLAVRQVHAEPSPEGLLAALTAAGALPEAEWSYLSCSCRTEEYALRGETEMRARRIVRLDIADALGKALADMEDERASVQSMANTFLDYYGAELLVLTVEGVNLQTLRAYYDHGIQFDEYAATKEE